jgi:hypothetical protein
MRRSPPQVELANLYQAGELTRLMEMAKQTDLTLDLVRGPRAAWRALDRGAGRSADRAPPAGHGDRLLRGHGCGAAGVLPAQEAPHLPGGLCGVQAPGGVSSPPGAAAAAAVARRRSPPGAPAAGSGLQELQEQRRRAATEARAAACSQLEGLLRAVHAVDARLQGEPPPGGGGGSSSRPAAAAVQGGATAPLHGCKLSPRALAGRRPPRRPRPPGLR